MFKKIKEKVLGLFVKKEEIIKLGKNKCSSRIKRVMVEGDTRFYYRIPLGDIRVLIISSCLPNTYLKDLLSGCTISLQGENGKVLRFRNSFIKNHPSVAEEKIAILEFSKMVKNYKRVDCKLSNDNIDEILNSNFNYIVSKYYLVLEEISNFEKTIGRTHGVGYYSKEELEEEKELKEVMEINRLKHFNLIEKNL